MTGTATRASENNIDWTRLRNGKGTLGRASSLTLHTGACLRKPTPSKLMSSACCTRGETHWKPPACKLTLEESCAIAHLEAAWPLRKALWHEHRHVRLIEFVLASRGLADDNSKYCKKTFSSWLAISWRLQVDIRDEMLNAIHSRCRLWLPSQVDEVTLLEQRAQAIVTETTCPPWTRKRSPIHHKWRDTNDLREDLYEGRWSTRGAARTISHR